MDNPVLRADNAPANRREAWIWLIEHAAWGPREVRAGRRLITLRRGQVAHAFRYLGGAWGWDVSKVRRFLTALQTNTMIDTDTDASSTVITICNYDEYQIEHGQKETQTDTLTDTLTDTHPTRTRHAPDTEPNKVNTLKERKKIQESTTPAQAAPPLPSMGLDLLGDPPAKTARQIMWGDGLPILKFVTGKPESGCRTLLGKLLRETRDDCSRVMSILHEAQSMHPLGHAEAWLMEAARGRDRRMREPVGRLHGLKELQDMLDGCGPAPDFDLDLTAEEIP
jgi:hypothetical protein